MTISTSNTIKLLRALSGQDNTYTIPKLYVRLTECHVRALVLNQLVFYAGKSTRHDDDWFDKDYEEWESETFIKERTLRNVLTEFKKKNWCESRTIKVNGKRKLLCRPLVENILSDINAMLEKEPIKQQSKNCPNRKILPDSQPANFAVSILYTDKTTDKTTTSKPTPSPENPEASNDNLGSSYFTQKEEREILALKLSTDDRSNDVFLAHCAHHVQNPEGKMKPLSRNQRIKGLKTLLTVAQETLDNFKASMFVDKEEQVKKEEAKRDNAQRKVYEAKRADFYHLRNVLKQPELKGTEFMGYEEWLLTQD